MIMYSKLEKFWGESGHSIFQVPILEFTWNNWGKQRSLISIKIQVHLHPLSCLAKGRKYDKILLARTFENKGIFNNLHRDS